MKRILIAATLALSTLLLSFHASAASASGRAAESSETTVKPGQGINLVTGEILTAENLAPMTVDYCSSNFICFYDGYSNTIEGRLADFQVSSMGLSCTGLTGFVNNKTSYIWNHSSSDFSVYDGGSCGTTAGYIYPQSKGAMAGSFDNTISSFKKLPIR